MNTIRVVVLGRPVSWKRAGYNAATRQRRPRIEVTLTEIEPKERERPKPGQQDFGAAETGDLFAGAEA